jgi:hypothetical protein
MFEIVGNLYRTNPAFQHAVREATGAVLKTAITEDAVTREVPFLLKELAFFAAAPDYSACLKSRFCTTAPGRSWLILLMENLAIHRLKGWVI